MAEESNPCADVPDGLAHSPAFVSAKFVEHDDVIGRQRLDAFLLPIGQEGFGIDRAVENPWRIDMVAPKGCDEGHCPPMAVGNAGDQWRAAPAPSPERGDIGFHPEFVNERKMAGIDLVLMMVPPLPVPLALRPVPLSRQNCSI